MGAVDDELDRLLLLLRTGQLLLARPIVLEQVGSTQLVAAFVPLAISFVIRQIRCREGLTADRTG